MKKKIIIYILIALTIIALAILVFIICTNKVNKSNVINNTFNINEANITTMNYLKELNIDVKASIESDSLIYEVLIKPKDENEKLSILSASGTVKVPVKVESNGISSIKLLDLVIDNFKKDDKGNMYMSNTYHEDGLELKEIKRSINTLSSTINFDYLYANYE